MSDVNANPVNPGDVLLGKYRVEKLLGMGNMGVVVAATHLGLAQRVAMKFMLAGKGAHAEQHQRFLREARAASRLKSQHVARVLDVGALESGAPYLVMEYLDGQDLASLLEARRQLPTEEAVEYVLQACEAVAEAHACGIVHRDLKPANLFLTRGPDGQPCVKVLDFGISKFQGDALALTGDLQSLGSPLYMSPEQMQASKDVDARSDLWALGVVLYELVAGVTPFHAENVQQLCARVFFGQPTPLASLRADVPAGFEAVILQCLEKDRERRWSSAAELAAALAPYAPVRAAGYVGRVANVLGVEVPVARATEVLVQAPLKTTVDLPAAVAAPPPRMVNAATTLNAVREVGAPMPQAPSPKGQRALAIAAIASALVAAGLGVVVMTSRGGAAAPATTTASASVVVPSVPVETTARPVPSATEVPAVTSAAPTPTAAPSASAAPTVSPVAKTAPAKVPVVRAKEPPATPAGPAPAVAPGQLVGGAD